MVRRSGDGDQRFRRPVPIRGVALALDSGTKRVSALRAGIDLPVSHQDGMAIVQLPDIALFELLLLSERPPGGREMFRDLDEKE